MSDVQTPSRVRKLLVEQIEFTDFMVETDNPSTLYVDPYKLVNITKTLNLIKREARSIKEAEMFYTNDRQQKIYDVTKHLVVRGRYIDVFGSHFGQLLLSNNSMSIYNDIFGHVHRMVNRFRTNKPSAYAAKLNRFTGHTDKQIMDRIRENVIENRVPRAMFKLYDDPHNLFYVDPCTPFFDSRSWDKLNELLVVANATVICVGHVPDNWVKLSNNPLVSVNRQQNVLGWRK